MRVGFNQNRNQNPYFGIMAFSPEVQKVLPWRVLRLQNLHATNPIKVDIVKVSEVRGKVATIYDHLLAAIINTEGKEIIKIQTPFFMSNEGFVKRIFDKTEKAFLNGSEVK